MSTPLPTLDPLLHQPLRTQLAAFLSGRGEATFSELKRVLRATKKFWLDRKKTAAISRHTNAFKINEDVVIPLPRMASEKCRTRAPTPIRERQT